MRSWRKRRHTAQRCPDPLVVDRKRKSRLHSIHDHHGLEPFDIVVFVKEAPSERLVVLHLLCGHYENEVGITRDVVPDQTSGFVGMSGTGPKADCPLLARRTERADIDGKGAVVRVRPKEDEGSEWMKAKSCQG